MKYQLLLLPIMALMAYPSNGCLLNFNRVNITNYDWKLVEAKNNAQNIIPELSNTDIEVNFNQNRIGFSGGCNKFTSSINLSRKNFKVGIMASTRMACEEELMKQDQLVGNFFDQETIQYITQQQSNNKVILTLKNSKNEILTLEGSRK